MADQKGYPPRQVAKRVFAKELREIIAEMPRDMANDKAPHEFLLPTGGSANRIFIVGSLTEKDDIGTDTEYWRGRIVDPTGNILIYAGQYQPEAAQVLANLETPCYVAIMGKIKLYKPEDGDRVISSVSAETIAMVDEVARDRWILETAHLTMERLKADTPESESRKHYGADTNELKIMCREALLEFYPKIGGDQGQSKDQNAETVEFSDDEVEEVDLR